MLKRLLKSFPLLLFLLVTSQCLGNDTILIRKNKIQDIQFVDNSLQIKDRDGCFEYVKFAWNTVPNFPIAIICPFQETFNGAKITSEIFALGENYYSIGNTLIQGCQDYTLVNSFPSKISSLCSYNEKQFLVGTEENGIYVCSGTQKQKLFVPNLALPEHTKQLIKIGDNIIINSGKQILTFKQSGLDVNSIYNSSYPLKMIQDDLQNIWIIDGNKLVCNSALFNPNLLSCKIESFKVDTEKITSDSKIDLSFFSYYPKNQSEVEYSYRLDASNWIETKNESVLFERLEPGKHSFEVRSSLGDGNYSLPVEKSFRVESTLKDSIWPIIFGFSSLLLIGFLFALRKQNNETKELTRSRDKLQLQNELLVSKQKILELQMNPHFLFNTLNSIQGLIALKKNKEARRYLKEFSQMMRSILQSSREENITIADEIKFLKNYMSLEQMARNDIFNFHVEVDASVNQEKKIPVMILQALLENSIVHGVASMHGTGLIALKLRDQGGKLHCTITDNGVGIDSKKKDKHGHKSYARTIIKERLKKYRIKEVAYSVPENGSGVIAEVLLPYL